jgi:glycosyltransferase involved in cell wall biosynthesis
MKVALLGPCPAAIGPERPDGPLAGGVDAVVLALARGLAGRPGVELSVVTALPGLSGPEVRVGDGFTLHCVPRTRGGRLTGQRQVVDALAGQIAQLAPDIVHAHSAGIYAGGALRSGLPAVITLHGIIHREAQQAWAASSWPDRLRWLADARYERGIVRRARDIIAISPYVVAEFRGRTRARFHLIENPVDDRFFDAPAPPPGQEWLLCVARIIPRKGILALVEAFALIAHERPAATLTVVGETASDPGYAGACRKRADDLGMSERVRFTGALPLHEIRAHYAASDVVLLASEQETAPVTIAEAMAVGRAVVSTDVGGCAALVVDGITGCIVPAKHPARLAAATIELLADPARCATMGRAGRIAAEARFRLNIVTDATLAVYGQILADAA